MKCKYDGSGVWAGRCTGTKEVDPCRGHDKCEMFTPVGEKQLTSVYALIYSTGVSTGYKELIGLYSTKEKADKMRQLDARNSIRGEWQYSIRPVKIDEALKIIYDEWG